MMIPRSDRGVLARWLTFGVVVSVSLAGVSQAFAQMNATVTRYDGTNRTASFPA